MQDLGGCRIILTGMDELNKMLLNYQPQKSMTLLKHTDYLVSPRNSGYRSVHKIYSCDLADKENEQRKIEVQFRTRLQHSWATAVEVIGAFYHEDMKASEGSKDWLRLFELMSAEFAHAEGTIIPQALVNRARRVEEIKRLNEKLDAIATLEKIRYAVHDTDNTFSKSSDDYFLIKFNQSSQSVTVDRYSKFIAHKKYFVAEKENRGDLNGNINTVLVKADKIETIKLAFPNYFGNVKLFCYQLNLIVDGNEAVEYKAAPKPKRSIPPKETPDMSWFYQRHRRKWD